MSDNKETVFHCGRFPHLVLTVKPFGLKDGQGNKIAAKHLHFGPDLTLGPGILRVRDEKMADLVRDHEYFKVKRIIEVTDVKDIPKTDEPEKVTAGVRDTSSNRPAQGEPKEEKARPVKAARTPGKK